MPGFMGLRGYEPKSPRDMEKARKQGQSSTTTTVHKRSDTQTLMEQRSREKAQEIIQGQSGDMSSFNQSIPTGGTTHRDYTLHKRVDKVMSGKVAVLSFDDTLSIAHEIFSNVRFHHLPIVNEAGCVIGIISDRDVLRLSSPFFGTVNEQTRDREIMSRKIGVIMTRNPVCIGINETIINAVKLLNSKKISCLLVVENDKSEGKKLLGIVTWKDIVRACCPAGFNAASESNRLKTELPPAQKPPESNRPKTEAHPAQKPPESNRPKTEAHPVQTQTESNQLKISEEEHPEALPSA